MRQIIKKELDRVFSDKKLMFSLFIFPALMVLVIYSIMGNMMEKMVADIKEHIPVIYIENAPEEFKDYVDGTGFSSTLLYFNRDGNEITAEGRKGDFTIEGLKERIKEGSVDLLVSFEEGFQQKIEGYEPGQAIPEVKTWYNPSEEYSAEARSNFLSQVLEEYRQTLLEKRIGSLDNILIFRVDTDTDSSVIMDEKKAGGKMMAMLFPYLIVILLFSGPMSMGVDSVTGEKERGTLASMLVTPLKRRKLVFGKLAALCILSCLSAVIYAVAMAVAVPMLFGGTSGGSMKEAADSLGGVDMGGMMGFHPLQAVELLLIMVSLVLLYVTLVTLISAYARTAREANSYISPFYILVMVAGAFTLFSGNNQVPLARFAIPVYGSAAAMQKIMTNELTMAQFGTALAGTLLMVCILTVLIVKAFDSEKVMFHA